jgi:hypothetical protein
MAIAMAAAAIVIARAKALIYLIKWSRGSRKYLSSSRLSLLPTALAFSLLGRLAPPLSSPAVAGGEQGEGPLLFRVVVGSLALCR